MNELACFLAGCLCTFLATWLTGRHVCKECLGYGTVGCMRALPDVTGKWIVSHWTEPCPACNGWRIVWKQTEHKQGCEIMETK